MGARSGKDHWAFETHTAHFNVQRGLQTDLLVVENVPEYNVQCVRQALGPAYKVLSIKVDPRAFGQRAARARVYIVAYRRKALKFRDGTSLHGMLSLLRQKPILSISHYFWKKLPPVMLSAPNAACLALAINFKLS